MRSSLIYTTIFAVAVSVFAIGCSGGGGGGGGQPSTGTSPSDLTSPNDFLNKPGVAAAIVDTQNAGFNLKLYDGISPPNIEGRYSGTGSQFLPGSGPLAPFTMRWFNQTPDNNIESDLLQEFFGLSAIGFGQIIRGSGNEFTVYTFFQATSGSCSIELVSIFDGTVASNGDLDMVMVNIITNNLTPSICFGVGSSNVLHLVRTGSAFSIQPDSDEEGIMDGLPLYLFE